MQITVEQVKSFQKLYKEKFGKEIPEEEARELGGRLLLLFKILMKNK